MYARVYCCADCHAIVPSDDKALELGWRFYCSPSAKGGTPNTAVCSRCVRARKFIFGDLAAEVIIDSALAAASS